MGSVLRRCATSSSGSVAFGHEAAKMSYVRRPSRNASTRPNTSSMKAPVSSSKSGTTQPPRSKPPLRSSSGPPGGPCATPSIETNAVTVSFIRFLLDVLGGRLESRCRRFGLPGDLRCGFPPIFAYRTLGRVWPPQRPRRLDRSSIEADHRERRRERCSRTRRRWTRSLTRLRDRRCGAGFAESRLCFVHKKRKESLTLPHMVQVT